MATQKTKVIDVTRSYIPIDPNAFPENYSNTGAEDSPEERKPVVPFEGRNFMPTSYGYKSYFGINSELNLTDITSRVDEVFVIQSATYQNIGVALCEDGIWTANLDVGGTWEKKISIAVPAAGTKKDWTKCVLFNDVFVYRANSAVYWRWSTLPRAITQAEIDAGTSAGTHPAATFNPIVPTFLNMTAQLGIFKAGSRLGFWDSANSLAWSSLDDEAQFKPDILTQAGNQIFNEVQGRITLVLTLGDGFVIYATRSITKINRGETQAFQWDPVVLIKDSGVAYPRQICQGDTVDTQYAISTKGLIKVESNTASIIIPEVTDFLKQASLPIYLTLLENRYLCLEILDGDYIDSLVSFTINTLDAETIHFPPEADVLDNEEGLEEFEEIEGRFNTIDPTQQALIDAYLASIGAVARNSTATYRPGYDIVLHDYPTWAPKIPGMDLMYLKGGNDGAPLVYNYSAPGVGGIDNTIEIPLQIGGLGQRDLGPSNYKAWAARVKAIRFIPVLDGGTPGPQLPEGTVLNLSAIAEKQRLIWKRNDADRDAIISFCLAQEGSQFGSDVYLSNNVTAGYIGTRSYSTTAPDNSPVSRPGLETVNANGAVITQKQFDVENQWGPAHTSITGRIFRYTRERRGVLSFYSKGEIIYKGDHTSFSDAGYVLIKGSNFALTATFDEGDPTNTIQEATATLTNVEYLGVDGLNHSVLWDDAWNLPDVAPFIYSKPGSVTLPPSYFLTQQGSVGPIYPTKTGAYVYDIQLKKWGKLKQLYQTLLDWSPLNTSGDKTIPFEIFGVSAGLVTPNGRVAVFDKYPVDSYIKYGKIGYFRQGFTTAEEVHVHFKDFSTGRIRTEGSIDGQLVELGLATETVFTDAIQVSHNPSLSCKWHTISLIGIFDIKYIEFRGTQVTNR